METPWAYPSALLTNTLTFRSNTVKWNESLHWHRQWINLMELFVLLVREKTLCEVVRSQTKRIKLNPPILESYKLINNKAEWKNILSQRALYLECCKEQPFVFKVLRSPSLLLNYKSLKMCCTLNSRVDTVIWCRNKYFLFEIILF